MAGVGTVPSRWCPGLVWGGVSTFKASPPGFISPPAVTFKGISQGFCQN